MNFKKIGLGFVLFGLVLGIGISSSASGSFEATLDSLNSQNFPFTFSNVRVTDNGIAVTDLTADNFKCSENGIVQTDFFQVTSPQTAGGVRLADIVFLIDASGSMGDAINGVKNNVNTFADALVASDVDYRLGLVQFGQSSDGGHPQLFNSGNLTDAAQFKEFVNTLTATGGYEPGFLALRMAAQGFNFRPGAQKVFLLISDEDSDDRDKEGTITLLQTNDVVVHTAVNCAAGYSSSDYCDGTSARAATGGQSFGVQGPYSDILDSIVTQTASSYVIRYKSSNPTFDGTERDMECVITRGADQTTVFGSYIPGSAPIIALSAQTEILNQDTLPENSPDAIIRAAVTDEVAPFAKSNGVWLYYRTSGSNSDYLSTMMILNGQYYEATIPIVSSPGVDYYLTATDGEQTSSLPSTDPGVYPFQIAVLPNVMPDIAHEPVISAIKNKPITITATITDTTEFLQEATLKYRRMGELIYKTIEMHITSGDTFEAIIPADDVTDDIEYYLIAKDNFNVAAYKATADEPFVIGFEAEVLPQCSDGIDNNGDGKIDKDDLGCYDTNKYEPDIDREAGQSFSFVHITDVHLGASYGKPTTKADNSYEYQSYPRFTDALYEIEKMEPNPDFILIGGDNVEYNTITWLNDFKSIIEEFTNRTKIEIYVIPGNHDRRTGAVIDSEGAIGGALGNDDLKNYIGAMKDQKNVNVLLDDYDPYKSGSKGFNQYNYYFNHKGFQFIGLDSGEDDRGGDLKHPEGEGLHDEVYNSLNTLAQNNPNVPKIIFTHHPMFTGSESWKPDNGLMKIMMDNNVKCEIEVSLNNSFNKEFVNCIKNLIITGLITDKKLIEASLVETDYDDYIKIIENSGLTIEGEFVQNGSITNHWRDFIEYSKEQNVQLVLSGHDHLDPVFDKGGQEIALSNWRPDGSWAYPLFIQTQSATKDIDEENGYGYRVIKVKDGKSVPQNAVATSKDLKKIISDLDTKGNLDFKVYDSKNYLSTVENDNKLSAPFIIPSDPDKMILYEEEKDDELRSVYSIDNLSSSSDSEYNLLLQKRNGDIDAFGGKLLPLTGYRIMNNKLCGMLDLSCDDFLVLYKDEDRGLSVLDFTNVDIKENAKHSITVDWSTLKAVPTDEWMGIFKMFNMEGLTFTIDNDSATTYRKMGNMITFDLNSPGELQVYDAAGNVTGLVNGEVKEDIPYSMYVPETETVYVFSDEGENIADSLVTKVVGSYEATYDLSITTQEYDEETGRFMANDIPTDGTTIHQFFIDWQSLSRGEDGVTMQIDKESDGVFEQTIVSDATLEASEITASNPVIPTNTGGGGGIYTAASPTDVSVAINNGESAAENAKVNLILSASGSAQMAISNSSDFADVGWEDFKTAKEWVLSAGVGEKTVYVKFRSANGGVSSVVSDSINLTEGKVQGAVTVNILDGDIIQCRSSADPFAVYIVKSVGDKKYIRHIVSPEIFNHYGHLKWGNIIQVDSLDGYSLSGWVRVNTGINGTAGANDKVYEINGDQTKHWINMTAEQFLTHGGSEEAIYNINQGELDMYVDGASVMSLW